MVLVNHQVLYVDWFMVCMEITFYIMNFDSLPGDTRIY